MGLFAEGITIDVKREESAAAVAFGNVPRILKTLNEVGGH